MLAGCSERTCRPPSLSVTAPITPPITNPATTAATSKKSTMAPTITSAIPLWLISLLLTLSPGFFLRSLSPWRPFSTSLGDAAQDEGCARHDHDDDHHQEDQSYGQEHHERRPASRS